MKDRVLAIESDRIGFFDASAASSRARFSGFKEVTQVKEEAELHINALTLQASRMAQSSSSATRKTAEACVEPTGAACRSGTTSSS